MRALIISWTLVVAAFGAPNQDLLQLKNGDRFRGSFFGYDAKKGFGWEHDSIFGELWVESSAVSRLQLNAGTGAAARPHSARVKFVNGDELSMDISSLDAEMLSLDTWFAGKLKSPRKHLMWLVPGGAGAVIYDGPKSLRGWGAGLIGVMLGDDGDLVGGVTVMEVMEASPALMAGMQIGDIVTHVNGKAVTLRGEMIQKVKQNEVGDKVKINILHNEMNCGLVTDTLSHEIGHCIGVFKHTRDGGLMDEKAGGSNDITSPILDMLTLLYTLAPGADINDKLAARRPDKTRGKSRYQPDGRTHYSGGLAVLRRH